VPEVNTYFAKYTAHTPPCFRLGCTTGRAVWGLSISRTICKRKIQTISQEVFLYIPIYLSQFFSIATMLKKQCLYMENECMQQQYVITNQFY